MQSGYTGCLRLMEWGSSLDGVDIDCLHRKLSGESEVLGAKCDITDGGFPMVFRKCKAFSVR